jgi:cold shock CspA family protein
MYKGKIIHVEPVRGFCFIRPYPNQEIFFEYDIQKGIFAHCRSFVDLNEFSTLSVNDEVEFEWGEHLGKGCGVNVKVIGGLNDTSY